MNLIDLDEFMVKRGGSVNPKNFEDETFELLSIPAFDKGEPEIVEGRNIGSSKKCVEPNDILLSKIVPHIRRCWVVPQAREFRQIASGEWIQFRSDQLYSKYLKFFLVSDPFHCQFMNTVSGVGGSLLRASPSQVARIKIPLPPLAEQQKIASVLDAADSLRQKDQQLIEKYTALSQSLFLEMFGDPVGNPMGWDKESLQSLVKSVVDCPHSTPKWTDSGRVAIRTSNLTKGGWSWLDKRFVSDEEFHERSKRGYVNTGDIILSREGTIGVLAIVSEGMEICLGQRLVQLIPDLSLANNYYLLSLLLYELEPDRISRVMVGATSKHLNVKELRAMKLPSPPLTLQNQFAERIQAIEAQKQQAQASLKKSDDLFNSLLQRAFKGELTASEGIGL